MSLEKFLVDRNIARDKKQAEIIMVTIIALCLIFIGIKLFGGGSSSPDSSLTPEERQQLEADILQGEGNVENLF